MVEPRLGGGAGGPAKWVIPATKANLWWRHPESEEVLRRYREGDCYAHLVSPRRSTDSVRVFSSLNRLLYDARPMSGLYTDRLREQHRESLISLLPEGSPGGPRASV